MQAWRASTLPRAQVWGGMSSDFAGKEQKDGICRKRAKGLLSCRDVSLTQLLCCGAGVVGSSHPAFLARAQPVFRAV